MEAICPRLTNRFAEVFTSVMSIQLLVQSLYFNGNLPLDGITGFLCGDSMHAVIILWRDEVNLLNYSAGTIGIDQHLLQILVSCLVYAFDHQNPLATYSRRARRANHIEYLGVAPFA